MLYRNYCYPCVNTCGNLMNIEGVGKIKALPDIAEISLAVITENKNLGTAQQQNAVKANEMISALLDVGVDKENIRSYSYLIEQIYSSIDGQRVFDGYRVTNKFAVFVEDIKKIGIIIDTAVENGANTVYNVDFQISNQSVYYRAALTKAVEDAIVKAKDIGMTLRTNVNSIPIKITEENYELFSPRQPAFRSPSADTPIIVGEVEISAKIKAVFIY